MSGSRYVSSLLESCDLCFIQEHWLLHEHLSHVSALESQFLSVSVSGMDSSVLLTGRPFGGCAILYRKSLAYSIIRLKPCSKRFCAISKLLIP